MSLLIDALRKAEADRKRLAESPETAREIEQALSLAPIDLDNADLPVADTRPAPTPQPPRASAAPRPGPSPRQAPQPAAGPSAATSQPPSIVAWALALGLLFAVAGAVYVWWQLQPQGLGVATAELAAAQATSPHPVTPPVIAAAPALPPASPVEPAPPTPARPAPAAAEPEPARPAPRRAKPGSTAMETADGPLIRRGELRHSNPAQSQLETAWQAYQGGQLDKARAAYLAALARDGRNLDALNGLAATALREGRRDEAQQWFERARRLDASNAVALAGLATLLRSGDAAAEESRLRSLLAEQPNAAPAHFALGLVLARSGRWGDAQQAFFAAHTLQAENPDYLYNLAVALDQLKQPRLARQHYTLALDHASRQPAAFDQAAARQRLASLAASAP